LQFKEKHQKIGQITTKPFKKNNRMRKNTQIVRWERRKKGNKIR
jgi:hypothetical protein